MKMPFARTAAASILGSRGVVGTAGRGLDWEVSDNVLRLGRGLRSRMEVDNHIEQLLAIVTPPTSPRSFFCLSCSPLPKLNLQFINRLGTESSIDDVPCVANV